jgi:hypothetical protein
MTKNVLSQCSIPLKNPSLDNFEEDEKEQEKRRNGNFSYFHPTVFPNFLTKIIESDYPPTYIRISGISLNTFW